MIPGLQSLHKLSLLDAVLRIAGTEATVATREQMQASASPMAGNLKLLLGEPGGVTYESLVLPVGCQQLIRKKRRGTSESTSGADSSLKALAW